MLERICLHPLILFCTVLAIACPSRGEELFGSGAHDAGVAPIAKPHADRKAIDTLMFSIDEFNEIQGRLAGGGSGEHKADAGIENADLYLSTILFNGPKDWTIWVNGVAIGPNQDFQTFQVTSITPKYVELLIPLSAQGMRPVRLGPNQTFIAKTGSVVEGHIH